MSDTNRLVMLCALITSKVFAQFDPSDCGIKKGCIFVPISCQHHNICRDIFSFTPNSDDQSITMEIFNVASNPASNYIAIGFSDDELMGSEAVTYCAFNDANIGEVHLSYNEGKSNVALFKDNEQRNDEKIVELLEASREDGKMYCKFKQRIVEDNDRLPNFNETYNILLAHGATQDPRKLVVHSLQTSSDDYPIVAPNKFNVAKFSEEKDTPESSEVHVDSIISKKTKRFFVLLHGIMMMTAWLFLIAAAIISARYLRQLAPSKTPFGLRIWFHIHRAANITAILVIWIALLFIFIGKGWRWTGPAIGRSQASNTSPGAIHSLIGAISAGLATAQPFGALLRCAPESRIRPIFNWIHRTIGLLSFILAEISVLIAAIFFHVWSSRGWAILLILVYILITIAFTVTIEVKVVAFRKRRELSKMSSFEMNAADQRRHENVHDNLRNTTERKVVLCERFTTNIAQAL
ncbi:unnamed protein product [Anisakis simplex]|uniref:Ferric-chelate reductase 1 (inferred by orthology to a human protein) n=1 Tax=Anisakis simplex TaxID=6269 RepID=A0A0M3JWB2_ANISI|nr:unnamed protein product [Anisakis simplex]